MAVLLEGRALLTPEFSIPSDYTSARLYMGVVKACVNLIPPIRFFEFCPVVGSGVMDMGDKGYDDRTLGLERAHPFIVTAGVSTGAEFDLDRFLHLKGFIEFSVPFVGTKVSYDAGAHWDVLPTRVHGVFGIEMSMYAKSHDPVTGH